MRFVNSSLPMPSIVPRFAGGFGSAVLEALSEMELGEVATLTVGVPDQFVPHGSQEVLRKLLGPGPTETPIDSQWLLRVATYTGELTDNHGRGDIAAGVNWNGVSLRQRLQKLADRISAAAPHGYRVFTDSAPVMEVALAEKAGLGWRGKHSLLLSREAGSFFFLGEIYTDLELPVDAPRSGHCGSCRACIDACPTGAIVAPYRVDARRCISYLTIELHGAIPEVYRPMIGNRVYGCDDCQWICPWNRFAGQASVSDFTPRNGLERVKLIELFSWTPQIFNERMAGSPIFRIGYERWMRNLAVGLGNAPSSAEVVRALQSRRDDESWLVREHVAWALERHGALRCGMSWQ